MSPVEIYRNSKRLNPHAIQLCMTITLCVCVCVCVCIRYWCKLPEVQQKVLEQKRESRQPLTDCA